MLINCPRCGFSQPQDQYCAQCGVDMQKFKPKEAPLLIQILSNVFFQVSVLMIAVFFVGKYILNQPAPQKFVQRIIHPQLTKSLSSGSSRDSTDSQEEFAEAKLNNTVGAFTQSENADSLSSSASTADSTSSLAGAPGDSKLNDTNSRSFKLTFAEVPIDVINKWINQSLNTGLYQSLPDYSIGILEDFPKLTDKWQLLKLSELKVPIGGSITNFAGLAAEDKTPSVGLTAAIELKSAENETLLGTINIVKTSPLGTDSYPSEFELPKGSAFFMVGALKIENFQAERSKLQMPPYQVFKSQDFMTHKTEFVIILEPVYK